MPKSFALLVDRAADLLAAVKEVRQVVNLPMGDVASAIKEQRPIPLPWAPQPNKPWTESSLAQRRSELLALFDRLEAAGASARVVVDGQTLDRAALSGKVAEEAAGALASRMRHLGDPDLRRIADGHLDSPPAERLAARAELGHRLADIDPKELIWTADSSHASELRRSLARNALARRGVDLKSIRAQAGPCPHPRWVDQSDERHACASCWLEGTHDRTGTPDARGWAVCSKCGCAFPD